MTSFSEFVERERALYSPPFLTHADIYRMCLRVDAAGLLNGKGTHISAFLYFMKGENNAVLDWPCRGKFSIELLNQENDENRQLIIVRFAEMEDSQHNCKVGEGRTEGEYDVSTFVSWKS